MNKAVLGRPLDFENREKRETRVYDLLDKLEIEYYRLDHEATATIESCQGVDKILNVTLCKNLFLRNSQKTKFYLLLMLGNKRFVTKELSKQINSARLSFAEAEFMDKFLDIKPGSVSIMGLMNDKDKNVQLLIDEEVLKAEYMAFHPCVNTTSLKIKTFDVINKILKEIQCDPIIVHL